MLIKDCIITSNAIDAKVEIQKFMNLTFLKTSNTLSFFSVTRRLPTLGIKATKVCPNSVCTAFIIK